MNDQQKTCWSSHVQFYQNCTKMNFKIRNSFLNFSLKQCIRSSTDEAKAKVFRVIKRFGVYPPQKKFTALLKIVKDYSQF